MKTILIVNQQQFGYLSDAYNYCLHLREKFSIIYICWDYGQKKIAMDGVNVIYIPRQHPIKWLRLAAYIRAVLNELRSQDYSIVFVIYFRGCSLLRLFSPAFRTMVMDIRTGSVRKGNLLRALENILLRFECMFYQNITIISESLMKMLGIGARKCRIFPVGGPDPHLPEKQFQELKLLYVGTLKNRDIHKTVEGLSQLYKESENLPPLRYDIVGDGTDDDMVRLKSAIEQSPCRDAIRFHGRIPHSELRPYFEQANVGVAFVPMTDYFQCQPVTKVFEYLLAGMPVVATRTYENMRVITQSNGVLVTDTAQGFHDGLKDLVEHFHRFDSREIKNTGIPFSWQNIVLNIVFPHFESLCHERTRIQIDKTGATPSASKLGLPTSTKL
ncbi:MAG: glycosyltransferase [Bacteroidota bacterium]